MTILEVDELTKSFGGLTAVDDVTFELESGQIYGLIGPNGAGKTTLFNIITGMLSPSQGDVRFNEGNITDEASHAISHRGIARTFQVPNPFEEMTVEENIRVGAYFSGTDRSVDDLTTAAIERTELTDLRDTLASSLSIGQLKRLEIARALATDPQLLMLDEPAAGLNPSEAQEIATLLPELLKEVDTILLVEHDMDVLMDVANPILVLNEGRLITIGSPEEISQNEEVIEAYLGPKVTNDA